MAQRNIDFGTFPDDPSADAIRTAFEKVQQNFTELFSSVDAQAVLSINRTPGAGITASSPTGNVIISANLANVTVSSTTLAVGRDTANRANNSGSATISSNIQSIVVELPQTISDIDNIVLDETLTANAVNANIITSTETLSGNTANFSGNVNIGGSLGLTGNLQGGNSISANFIQGTLTTANQPNITNVGTLTSLNVSGNLSANVVNANSINLDGNLSLDILTANSIVGSLATASQPNITEVGTLTALSVTGNLSAGNIDGGNLVQASFFSGDGNQLSNITGANVNGTVANATHAITANTIVDSAQPNITSVGSLTNLDVLGNANVGAMVSANTGVFTYVFADGSNLSALTGANVTGEVSFAATANAVAGANVSGEVAFADTANNVAGANVSGQVANALVAGTVYTNAQPNITSVGTLTSLDSSGNITAANITANTGVFTGNGSGLSALTGSNVTGEVSFAATANAVAGANVSGQVANALVAGTVYTNAQPNITSVGTLTSLDVTGDITASNITSSGGIFAGNGSGLTNLAGANVTGTVANATFADNAGNANIANIANSATIAETVSASDQPNITSVGLLTSLDVQGNLTSGNIDAGNLLVASFVEGTLTTANQPNITDVGTLTSLDVTGNISAGNIDGGNLVSANFIQGDGSLLTNISVAAGSFIENGNSEVRVDANSNVRVAVNGVSNVAVFTQNGLGLGGFLSANNVIATSVNASSLTGNLTTSSQPNVTSLGNLTSLTVDGVSNLGPNSNVIITGGVSNAFLMTDGAGNLSWNTATLVPAQGNDTEVIFNDGGNVYAGDSDFTYNKTTNSLTVGGNISAGNLSASGTVQGSSLTGTLTTSAQPSITSLGILSSLNVSGNITAVNITANTGVFAGDGGALSNIAGANVVGAVSSATSATTASTVTTNAQPNITSVGTLSSLIVSGNINSGNLQTTGVNATSLTGTLTTAAQPNVTSVGTLTGLGVNGNITATNITANTGVFTGNGFGLSSLVGANVTGTVANATFATSAGSANTAGTVTTNAQPNITSVGSLTSLIVSGNINVGNITTINKITAGLFQGNASNLSNIPGANVTGTVANATNANTAATVTTNAQPNITSVGTLTSLGVSGNITAANITANTGIFAGNGSGLTSLNANNLSTGTVPSARLSGSYTINITGSAATVTTSAQPNITSVGTLTSLTSSGNVSAANVNTTGYHIRSVGTGISAAGTTQGTATALSKEINVVSTVSGTAGVRLPTAVAGMVITITNTTANTLRVYPATGGAINTLSANAAFVQGPGATLQFIAPTTTQWYTTGATYA